MSDINNTSAAQNKNLHSFSLTDNYGNSYLFVRSRHGFFNIAKCEVLTDGKVPNRDGLIPNAIPFHAEEVAYLVAESEARNKQLERIKSLLERWIDLRRSRSRKAKQRLHQLQKPKHEVAK